MVCFFVVFCFVFKENFLFKPPGKLWGSLNKILIYRIKLLIECRLTPTKSVRASDSSLVSWSTLNLSRFLQFELSRLTGTRHGAAAGAKFQWLVCLPLINAAILWTVYTITLHVKWIVVIFNIDWHDFPVVGSLIDLLEALPVPHPELSSIAPHFSDRCNSST